MKLARQTRTWKEQDPEAQIRVAEVGYSRGAVLAPGLARLVDHYGIASPKDLHFGRDEHGAITVESPTPPLVPPGQVAQAMSLFDPVGTHLPKDYDARSPASVISVSSMIAVHEQRLAFPHETIAAAGLSADARMLDVPVPGGHSNVGGGNREGGLEALAFNYMADYLNALSDQPFVTYRPLPADPGQYTVYQAHGMTALPGMDHAGQRNLQTELANCKRVDPCRNAEPMDQALAGRFTYRTPTQGAPQPELDAPARALASPAAPSRITPDDPAHPDHALLEQIRRGVRACDALPGRGGEEDSERLSRSLLAACKDNRERYPGRTYPLWANEIECADHVVMGADKRFATVVQGALDSPLHKRAAVEVEQAMRTPVEQSDAKLEAANQTIAQQLQQVRAQAVQQEQVQQQTQASHGAMQR